MKIADVLTSDEWKSGIHGIEIDVDGERDHRLQPR